MPALLDHLIVPVRQKETSARFYADVLGFDYLGPSTNDNVAVRVNSTFTLLFHDAAEPQRTHLCFRVTEPDLDALLERLEATSVPYGNHARTPNRRTDHMWGCRGIYFEDPDSHSLEVVAAP
jgi:catechol 2,3-dioxygenase-like lactoylglutathione lyase family enzyme